MKALAYIKALIVGAEKRFGLSEQRIVIFSAVAVVAFPLYYFIWHDLFPQPYENIRLRFAGSAIFFPLVFYARWPEGLKRFRKSYLFGAMLFGLPFFFTFMLLKNGTNTVWLLSTLVAIFLMILLLDWISLLAQFTIGISLAWLAFTMTTDVTSVHGITLEAIPIFLFAVLLGSIANYSAESLQKARLRAMFETAGNIAHELRTPLLGIRSGAAGLQQYLPALLEAYKLAKEHGLPIEQIRKAHLNLMDGVLERIKSEADHSNTIIDMLLMNARMDRTEVEEPALCSMKKCIETAILRYPFASERERQQIKVEGADFNFHGAEILMVHVLFNLLKNALYYIAKAGKGEITIRLTGSEKGSVLIFRDTGTGIPQDVLPHIFTRFYTWVPERESKVGTGVGLAFCRSVMSSLGGSISCRSVYGEYTEFVLTFPELKELTP